MSSTKCQVSLVFLCVHPCFPLHPCILRGALQPGGAKQPPFWLISAISISPGKASFGIQKLLSSSLPTGYGSGQRTWHADCFMCVCNTKTQTGFSGFCPITTHPKPKGGDNTCQSPRCGKQLKTLLPKRMRSQSTPSMFFHVLVILLHLSIGKCFGQVEFPWCITLNTSNDKGLRAGASPVRSRSGGAGTFPKTHIPNERR